MKRTAVVVAMLSLALAEVASEARGSVCIVDGMFAEVSPPIDSVVPRNARVRVRLTMAPR